MNLCVARVRKQCAATVCTPCSGHIAIHCIGRQEEHVSISTCCQHHSVCCMRLNFTGQKVAHNNSCATTINRYRVNKFGSVEQTNSTQANLASHLLVCTNQQLLAGLTAGIERAAYLCATKAAIIEQSAVFTSEWNTLSNHLVDDVNRYLSQTMHVRFTRTKVTTLNGVLEQTINAVTVTLIILCSVNSTLCRNGVRTTR